MKYVLGIDQSTQGTKALLFDEDGNMVCREDIPHEQIINEKGWVSHDLNEIYKNTLKVVRKVIEKSGIQAEEIVCAGISNQRETSAVWNRKNGKPLAPAIVWQCSRAENICEKIKSSGKSEMVQERTGLMLSPYFPASKFAWFLENVEGVMEMRKERKLCFGTIDTWLIYKLTNGKAYKTEYSNASRTQLFNIQTLNWDKEICGIFGIYPEELPEVCDSNADFGSSDFGGIFTEPIPICGVIGDSQGALFGQGCLKEGMLKATYGTGSSVMMNIGEKPAFSKLGLVTSLAWGLDGKVNYVMEGNINYTGAIITWLKDEMGLIRTPGESQELAYAANKNDTTYLVPAFSGLGAPYWEPRAKALIYGMSRITGKKEIVKAALESIAYQITDVVWTMSAETDTDIKEVCVDGGPTNNRYLMNFQSDILGIALVYPRCEESSGQGAAYIAGLKYGIYQKEKLFTKQRRNQLIPAMEEKIREQKYQGWRQAIRMVKNNIK